jgi:integrative and conjugative element protein (TIGR02256 family)
LRAQAVAHEPFETGGLLLGYWARDSKEAVITEIVGGGPGAVRTEDSFVPDRAFQVSELEAAFFDSDGRDNYLGEWHSHPRSWPKPSWTDRLLLRRIVLETNGDLLRPLMLIVGARGLVVGWQGVLRGIGRLSIASPVQVSLRYFGEGP